MVFDNETFLLVNFYIKNIYNFKIKNKFLFLNYIFK